MDPTVIGNHSALNFSLTWLGDSNANSPAETTRGELIAKIGDRLVWGIHSATGVKGLEWTWIELLEHLANHWSRIAFEESDPLGLNESPKTLRVFAEKRWDSIPALQRDSEESALWDFEESHNLATALQGIWPPPLWILREGNFARVSGNGADILAPFELINGVLETLGETIAARIKNLNDPRSTHALKAWAERHKRPARELVKIYTGLSNQQLEEIAPARTLNEILSLDREFSGNELLAAARMAAPELSSKEMSTLLGKIRKVKRAKTDTLDAVTAELSKHINADAKPFEQGFSLARAFRKFIGNAESKFDPLKILGEWNVSVQPFPVFSKSVEAICIWGPKHGPGVFHNPNGLRSKSHIGLRSTLAHEICHLLADRNGSLPLAEVLGGKTPRSVEQRANAFAAELLLPQECAADVFNNSDTPQAAVKKLTSAYGVSREVCAWQILNSSAQVTRKERQELLSNVDPNSPSMPALRYA